MLSHLCLFVNIGSASPLDPFYSKPQQLPAVIVQGYTSTEWNQQFPDLPSTSLGPKQSKSILLPQPNIDEALLLVEHLTSKDIDAWMDQLVIHTHNSTGDYDDPNLQGQWYIDSLNMFELWSYSRGSAEVNVAIVDSGIDISHPDLANKLVAPYDAFSEDNDPSPNIGEYCWQGAGNTICDEHGTAVAGISVAEANQHGIVGMCPECSLIPIKMLGEGPAPLSEDVAAMEHAIANNAAVINNSWGYSVPMQAPAALVNVIERAQTETRDGKGAVVVFAAGNDNRELIHGELCGISGVICVSAIDSYGRPTAYTNYGSNIDLAAPSATVSIAPDDSLTTNFGGTSAAAPVISGLAAWILSVKPELSSVEVADLIIRTAEQSPLITPDDMGHHEKYGFGVVHPTNILEILYPAEFEEATKGGCNSLSGYSSSVKFYPIIMGLIGLVGLVRRQ